MRRPVGARGARTALLAACAGLLLLAGPAAAENPVLDAEGDADVVDALAEATEVQDVCYGYLLTVRDADTGRYDGTFSASSLGTGQPPRGSGCSEGTVELQARISYTSSFSEQEDSASWVLDSSVPGLTIEDVEDLGLSSGDLLDDGTSEVTLLNAVLALPRLASEAADLPPVLLEENTAALPDDARPTGTPGSDFLRENAAPLVVCALLLAAAVALVLLSFRPARPLTPDL